MKENLCWSHRFIHTCWSDIFYKRMGTSRVKLFCFLFLGCTIILISKAEENVCSAVKDRIVRECPNSEHGYEKVSKDMNCTTLCGADYQFHCIRDNRHRHLHYICAISTKIIRHCPEYNVGGQVVQNDYSTPYRYDACADCVYINSQDVYKYPYCLRIPMENKERRHPKGPLPERFYRNVIPLGIFILVIFLVIFLACVLGVLFSILCYEKFTRKTSWKKAFRRVRRYFTCQQTDDENSDSNTPNQLFSGEGNEPLCPVSL